MKSTAKIAALLLGTGLLLSGPQALARDTALHLPFDAAVAKAQELGKLDGTVKFHLAGKGPKSGKVLEEIVTNKKTNSFNKTDEEACAWVLYSALITLQSAAKKAGADSVSNIVSFYKKNEFSDGSNYECHVGGVIAGVALKANLVKN
jgi:hypothetical protein